MFMERIMSCVDEFNNLKTQEEKISFLNSFDEKRD